MAGYSVGQADAFVAAKNLIDDYKRSLLPDLNEDFADGAKAVCDGFNEFVVGSLALLAKNVNESQAVLQEELHDSKRAKEQ